MAGTKLEEIYTEIEDGGEGGFCYKEDEVAEGL